MTHEILVNLKKNSKREEFFYDIFDVSIWYFGGMFCISLIGGWDYNEQVPDYGFGTSFEKDIFYPGFDKAIQVALSNIRNSSDNRKIKNIAESALARACVEFTLKHKGML